MAGAKVAVFGGGVAGLTAAHELADRRFSVDIYERRPREAAGGKARSIKVPGTATRGREPLPGEHGFRFFPGFYRHLPDTMGRIPFGAGGVVSDNLVTAVMGEFAGEELSFTLPGTLPLTIADVTGSLLSTVTASQVGVPPDELAYFVDRLLVILTTGERRRLAELENTDWTEFVGAKERSHAYDRYLADGMTRRLVAARANEISARTCGIILLQLLGSFQPGERWDRLLNGPTNDKWIDPWVAHLDALGVRFHDRSVLTKLESAGKRITGATVDGPSGRSTVTADYYVVALPVEQVAPLVTPAMAEASPSLGRLPRLAKSVEWMNGIQFFLKQPLPLVPGHIIYQDSNWSLTSISQAQFWKDFDFSRVGDGQVKDILSVDISDWETEGVVHGKKAMDCTKKEIEEEVIAQLKRALNRPGSPPRFPSDLIHSCFIDDSIVEPNPGGALVNLEPLLVNTAGSWYDRPEATTGIENLFLAGDYVQTHTDLATMEGANESARRAVNGILAVEEATGKPKEHPDCEIFPLKEAMVFRLFRNLDDRLFAARLPHLSEAAAPVWDVSSRCLRAIRNVASLLKA